MVIQAFTRQMRSLTLLTPTAFAPFAGKATFGA
jgi:hypothetical protein